MSTISKNRLVFQNVTGVLLLAILSGCGGAPDRPAAGDNDGLLRIAEQLHERGDDASAADFYMRALRRDPDNAEIHAKLAALLESHGDLNGAATQYRLALGMSPDEAAQDAAPADIASDDANLIRAYGRVLIMQGKPDLARVVYERALRIDPDDVRSLNGLGVALDQLGSHDAAQRVYREALEDKPGDPATLANLGHSYVLAGAYQQAIDLLEPHLGDKDATPALRQNLAEAYGMAGMDADAERVAKLDLTPDQVRHNMAYYREQRAHLSRGAALYADLGHFPTADIAAAHADEIKAQFPDETGRLNVAAIPEVAAIGGTPSFAVHVTGFEHMSALRAFCLKLKARDFACAPKTEN